MSKVLEEGVWAKAEIAMAPRSTSGARIPEHCIRRKAYFAQRVDNFFIRPIASIMFSSEFA